MPVADELLISVIVPCYNYASYVAEALRSVLAQTHPSFELIVVDDGSTDDSAKVIEAALFGWEKWSKTRRVVFLRQPNQGVSAALNSGLAEARGEFVATFDADDVMPAGRLDTQARYLSEHPEVGCVGGLSVRIDGQGALLPKKIKRRQVSRYDFDQALAAALVVGGNIAMFRRDVIEQVGGYDPSIRVQDFQMTLKVARAGYFVDVLPEVVTLYRKHPGSLSGNYKAEYEYGLQALAPYRSHPAYVSGKTRLIGRILRGAVVDDKAFAWSLLRQVPLRHWDHVMLRRLRHLLCKPLVRPR